MQSFTHPRKIGLPLGRPILLCKNCVHCLDNGLVRRSANWSCMWTCQTWRLPCWTKSCTKWILIWMCFMCEWFTGLKLRWVAPRLSHRSFKIDLSLRPSSLRREWSHIVLDTAFARAQYSASIEDWATTFCIREWSHIIYELQEMEFLPTKLICKSWCAII